MKPRRTILAWLAGALLLAIPYALFASMLLSTGTGLLLLLVLPALEALLALLLIHWRSVAALWASERVLVSLLLAGLLLALAATILGNVYVTALLLLPALFLALLWTGAGRMELGGLAVLGLLLAAFMWIDAAGLAGNHYVFSLRWLRGAYEIGAGLAAMPAVALAALFVYRAVQSKEGAPRRPAAYLALAALLIFSVALVTLRLGLLTNATGRGYDDHFPLVAFSAGLMAGLVLLLSLKDKARRAGWAFLVLAPMVVVSAYTLGWRIEPQAITAARAVGIRQAIERYRRDTGRYPDELGALFPRYVPVVLGPLTGRGQVWCYESSPDHYRLGYVVFERYHEWPDETPFWEPYYAIQIAGSAGPQSPGPWICDTELMRFRQHGGL